MTKEVIILGNDEGFTIYKNSNEEMVKQIQNIKIPRENFNTHRHKNANIAQILNENQNLCIDENKEYFIATNKDIDGYTENNLLNEINNRFNVIDAIQDTFGDIYSNDGLSKINFHYNMDLSYNEVCRIGNSQEGFAFYCDDNNITLKQLNNDFSHIMFCHLNKEGNIVNRDYNLNLTEFIGNTKKSLEYVVEKFIEFIPDVQYENYNNIWFNKNFAITMNNTSLVKITSNSNGTYGYGSSRIKRPKKIKPSDKNHIISEIMKNLKNSRFCDVDLNKYIITEESKIITPMLRIQQTKLDEKKYEIYEINENDLGEEEISALKNIERSIDISNNEEFIRNWLNIHLKNYDLPSFSFNKAEKQPNHNKFKGLVKMPYGSNFTFKVCEGDVCEITWSHSIYITDIVDLEFVY